MSMIINPYVYASAGAGTDPLFSYVRYLNHFDGPNGSTSFVDVAGHTLTGAGTARIDTSASVFGGAAGYFDGGYISAPSSADWDVFAASNRFTWEGWVRVPSTASWTYGLLSINQGTSGLPAGMHIQRSGSVYYLYVYRQGEANGYYCAFPFTAASFANYLKVVSTGSGAPLVSHNGSMLTMTSFDYSGRTRATAGMGLVHGSMPNTSGMNVWALQGSLDEWRITAEARTDSFAIPSGPFPNS